MDLIMKSVVFLNRDRFTSCKAEPTVVPLFLFKGTVRINVKIFFFKCQLKKKRETPNIPLCSVLN